jgi:DNA-binding MarR family transcriptional regulator
MDIKNLSSALRMAVSGLHKTLRKQNYPSQLYSMTEMETIGHLTRNGRLLPSELAVLTRVKTQSMSQIIKKMEDLGVVERTPSVKDKRKVYISLTTAGKKIVEKTIDERDEWMMSVIQEKLNREEQKQLESLIPLLNKLLETK